MSNDRCECVMTQDNLPYRCSRYKSDNSIYCKNHIDKRPVNKLYSRLSRTADSYYDHKCKMSDGTVEIIDIDMFVLDVKSFRK